MTLGYAFVTMATAFGDGALHYVPVDTIIGLLIFYFHSHKAQLHIWFLFYNE